MIDLYTPVIARLQRFSAGQRWKWRATCWLVLLSFFLHFPSYNYFHDHLTGREIDPWWVNIEAQRDHPLTYVEQPPGSHLEKTTFRLTVPLIAKLFHLNALAIYLLQVGMGTLLVFLTLAFCAERAGDRVLALLFTGGLVFTYAGSAAFFDIWGLRDPFAYFFLLLAVFRRNATGVFLAVLLAAFSDERSLIASSCVLLFHAIDRQEGSPRPTLRPNAAMTAVVSAWAVYLMLRYALVHFYGFRTGTGELGLKMFFKNLEHLPWGLWSGLEGAWLVVIAFLVVVARRLGIWWLLLFSAALGIISLAAILVDDTTRSMAYGFIILFPAFEVLRKWMEPRQFQVILFFAFLVSLIHPMYFTLGTGSTFGVEPALVKVLELIKLRYHG